MEYKSKYTVKGMCKVLKVSELGYYRWLRNRGKPSSRQLLSVEIQKIIDEHPDNDNYGVERMRIALSEAGIETSKSTVWHTMKEMGLIHKRRIPHGITKATSEILALEIGENMKKELCIATVRQLNEKYGNKLTGAIFHSDRGSPYTSGAFRKALADSGMIQSLSGAGHCFDNARMESFFATLKKEKIYRIAAYKHTREEVKTIIFRYVFIYYNRIRVYTTNPYGLSPVKYREWAATHKNPTAA